MTKENFQWLEAVVLKTPVGKLHVVFLLLLWVRVPLQGGELQTHDDDEAARAPGVTIHQYEGPT